MPAIENEQPSIFGNPRGMSGLSMAAIWGLVVALIGSFATSCVHAVAPIVIYEPPTRPPPPGAAFVAPPWRLGVLKSNAVVNKLTDGDTLGVDFGDARSVTIRLLGIDTPESKRPNTPVECFAHSAAEALAQLVPLGTNVTVMLDRQKRDKYDRLLGYIYRSSDGLFINHEMVRTAMALPLSIAPNTTFSVRFEKDAIGARYAKAGLWAKCEGGHEPA